MQALAAAWARTVANSSRTYSTAAAVHSARASAASSTSEASQARPRTSVCSSLERIQSWALPRSPSQPATAAANALAPTALMSASPRRGQDCGGFYCAAVAACSSCARQADRSCSASPAIMTRAA